MTTIAEVRSQLAAIVSTIDGWSGAPYIADQINHGVIQIGRPAFDPRMVFSQSKADYTFTATAYASPVTPEASEAQLDALCELTGDGSLLAAVQDGANWTAVTVDYAQVISCGQTRLIQYGDGGASFLACPFEIKVVW